MAESLQQREQVSVRVGPMVNIPTLLDRLGAEPTEVVAGAGLSLSDFDDPDRRLDYVSADLLLHECARSSACPHFGLLLGQMAEPWHLGLPGLVVYVAPTVRQALESLRDMIDLHDQGISLTLDIGGDYTRFGSLVHGAAISAIDVIHDLTATFICRILEVLCGPRWRPTAVSLPRRHPRNVQPYQHVFRAPIHFDAAELTVAFENRWLDRSPASSDPSRFRQIKLKAAELHDKAHKEPIDLLPMVILQGILSGDHTAHAVGALLGMHERTLNRRLSALGTSYRAQLDATRLIFGEQLLGGTDMPIRDIATALGFAHANSFIRAFERCCGLSPAQWRAQHPAVRPASDRSRAPAPSFPESRHPSARDRVPR